MNPISSWEESDKIGLWYYELKLHCTWINHENKHQVERWGYDYFYFKQKIFHWLARLLIQYSNLAERCLLNNFYQFYVQPDFELGQKRHCVQTQFLYLCHNRSGVWEGGNQQKKSVFNTDKKTNWYTRKSTLLI